MRRPLTQRKCKHCQTFFAPDPRSAKRQRHCSQPECRQASKAASQRRWHHKPHNRDYFRGPTQVERVRQWRKANPGYWRRQGARAPYALQLEVSRMHQRPISLTRLRKVPHQFSWGDQRLVRERYIDQLSHEACALYLFLGTVADAQGLSFYADRSLDQRLSMSLPILRQARQALITRGLIAYQHPLYQVLALGVEDRADPTRPAADDDAVDIKAVVKQIWEVLS